MIPNLKQSSSLAIVSLIWVFCGLQHPANGQQASVYGPPELSPKFSGSQSITDIFIGKNVVGPYLLSWKNIETGSETISVNGRLFFRGQDYNLDPKTGVLTFPHPLRTGQIARPYFPYIPGQSPAMPPGAPIPFEFKLFGGANSSLNFNALYQAPTNTPLKPGVPSGTQNGLMLLGFGGKNAIGTQSTLTSKIYFDPTGGRVLGKSGIQLAEASKLSFGQFTAGFTRAGPDFKAV